MGIYRMGDYELDGPQLELRHEGVRVAIEPMVFDVIRYLVEHSDRVVTKEELLDQVWGDRFVGESALTSRIKSARRALGDDGRSQHMVRTVHGRGYQYVGPLDEADPETVEAPPMSAGEPRAAPLQVRFVTVRGGLRLAVGETGSGLPLVKAANWMTNVDKDTESPIWVHWVRDLSRRHRFIRYDARGCGLSDRDLAGIPLDDLDLWVDDLTAVVDSLGLDQFALLGISQGGPVATTFAARNPDRVSHLILVGAYARGMNRRDDILQADQASLQIDLARVGWASDDDRFLEVFTKQFIPDAGPVEQRWFNELQKTSTDAKTASQLEAAFHDVDVSDVARTVAVPTLVVHSVDDVAVPFEEGRRLAGLVPDARFLPLQSANHILLEREPAWAELVDEIDRFTGA